MKSFKEFKISNQLVEELKKHGIVVPTKVQELSIPSILKGKDVLVQSETGSGKTLSFAIPVIETIKRLKEVQVLVITPTRELAKQVGLEFIKYTNKKDLRTAIVYGGVSIERQAHELKSADIVVGTPGRLLDLLNRRLLNLTYVKFLVLDEADRMLDMGFIEDMNEILKYTPVEKQVLMFSATINSQIMRLMEEYLKDPVKLLLENLIKRGVLEQFYYDVNSRNKISLLIHLLQKMKHNLVLVFCNTKRQTAFVSGILKRKNIKAECLNGDMSQHAREKVMKLFALGKVNILVATDVAARGIHVEDITHVVNFDLPEDPETYTHRIGRTARNGKRGTAIVLLSDRDFDRMAKIKSMHKNIERAEAPDFKPRSDSRPQRRDQREDKERRGIQKGSNFPRRRIGGPRRTHR